MREKMENYEKIVYTSAYVHQCIGSTWFSNILPSPQENKPNIFRHQCGSLDSDLEFDLVIILIIYRLVLLVLPFLRLVHQRNKKIYEHITLII